MEEWHGFEFGFGCETSCRVEDGGDFEFWVEDTLDAIFAKVEIVGFVGPLDVT